MTEPNTDTSGEVQVDVLELSDEDFEKIIPPADDPIDVEEEPSSEETSDESTVDPKETSEMEESQETEDAPEPEEEGSGGETLDDSSTPGSESVDEPTKEKTEKEVKESPENAESTESSVVDYKTEYEKLMTPFKANGVDMQIKNVDDAIQLMKMGAGFHKKMSALKPNLRQMKLLEKHGLLDEEKLNFLIDLNDRKPEAIQKFLKDANIDPLDIDVKAETNYKPTNREVSDTELALDEVINEIRDTPTFQKTLNVVSKEWDESSQNTIATEPHIISIINGHIADGTFDAVMQRVDYERNLGRLKGISDLDAYKQMGNAMANEGILQRAKAPQANVQQPASVQPPMVKPSKEEIDRKKKKRAASPTKGSKTTVAPTFDPLDLSDEDFAKLDINKYIKSR